MTKQKIEFAVVTENNVVMQVGKAQIYQPKTNFKGGEIKWFDDNKLIKKQIATIKMK